MSNLDNRALNQVITEMPAPTAAPPETALPPPSAPPLPSPRRPKALYLALLALAVLTAVGLGIRMVSRSRNSGDGQALRTATVEQRDFVRSVRVTGTVEATESYIIAAPSLTGGGSSSMVIMRLVPAGTRVKKGDLLVEFDRQNQIKNALDKQAEFRDLEEQINKKRAEQEAARAKDDTELKQAEDGAAAAALEVRRNEVASKIDAEKNLANLEEARARFQQLQATFALKRRAAQAELKVLEIQRDRARRDMLHAQHNAEKMAVHAPLDGVVVLNTIWKGGQMAEVQEGDEIRPGVPFMQVMNPASMQVRAKINQADMPWLKVGQAAQVQLDAYPGLTLPARLERTAAIGITSGFSQRLRSFTAMFSIQGADPKLMPDLTASIDVQLERVPTALVVPRGAVVQEAGAWFVWKKNGSDFQKTPVKVASLGDVECAIESGLEAGAVVLRSPPQPARSGS